jgi:hypothetical protein
MRARIVRVEMVLIKVLRQQYGCPPFGPVVEMESMINNTTVHLGQSKPQFTIEDSIVSGNDPRFRVVL